MKKITKKSRPDYILLTSVILLNIIGLIALAGASALKSLQLTGKSTYFLLHQILFALLPGIILGGFFYKINPEYLKKLSFFIFIFALLLTAAVFIPKIGTTFWGGRRWVRIFNFSFQPSEFLKFAFILYLSAWLAKRNEEENKLRSLFLPFIIILTLISIIFIFQPDISTMVIFGLLGGILYFSAKTPISHLLILGVLGIIGITVLIYLAPYRLNRLLVFLNPEADPLGKGYHIKQALIAVGSGGIFGKGLGLGEQKLGFLPQPMTDSIFAVFGEEVGFLGTLTLLLLFLIFAWRGYTIAKSQKNEFQKLVAIGITSWIIVQAFVNIGTMIGILPLTGMPLPFLSYGGSALICELMSLGLLLNISRQTL
jgi:cell division protein FtsW